MLFTLVRKIETCVPSAAFFIIHERQDVFRGWFAVSHLHKPTLLRNQSDK